MTLEPESVLRVMLVFVRIGGLFVAAPFFGRAFIPVPVKVLLAALLAVILSGFSRSPLPPHVDHAFGFALAALVEAGTGLLLGFAAQFVFYAVQTAGEALGYQMSLGMAQAYDPASEGTSNPLGQMLGLAFLLLFVLLDGPHHLIRALAASFEVVPIGGARLSAGGPLLIQWTGAFFATALRLAAPFMVTLFLLDVALGIFARVVPQADLFSLSLPAKLLLGLGAFFVFVQGFTTLVPSLVEEMIRGLSSLLIALAG